MTVSESEAMMEGSATAMAENPSNKAKKLNTLFMSPVTKNAAVGLAAHQINPIALVFQ